MRLSIVVPVYNVERYLKRCIQSCETQDIPYSDYEIIAVNDGSTDNSLSILQEESEKFPNITVVTQKNRGLSGARMVGLSHSSGKYVWFVDSDDWIENNCLGKLLNILECNDLDALQVCAASYKEGKIARYVNLDDSKVTDGKSFVLQHKLTMCVPFTLYRREFLLENNLSFYEGIFHEDFQFSPRAYYFAQRVMSINNIVYYYFLDSVSIMRSVNPKKAYDYLTVADTLYDFKQGKNDCETAFNYYISMAINNALVNVCKFNNEQVKELNAYLYKLRYLFSCQLKSQNCKYFFEGVLFSLFPKRVCDIYLMLVKFCH